MAAGYLSTHAGQWCAVSGALPICPMGTRERAEAAAKQMGVKLDGRIWDGDAGRWINPPRHTCHVPGYVSGCPACKS
jgi:hypothetical protein